MSEAGWHLTAPNGQRRGKRKNARVVSVGVAAKNHRTGRAAMAALLATMPRDASGAPLLVCLKDFGHIWLGGSLMCQCGAERNDYSETDGAA